MGMTRVIAYIRVSTNLQDVDNQRFGIASYCEWNKIIVNEWVEDVITGKSEFSDRNFGVAYEKLEKGDMLIVTELSRLSRDFFGTVKMIENLIKKEIILYSLKENFTLKNDFPSKMLTAMYGMAAQIERDRISQRVKEGMAKKASEGVIMGRPIGRKTDMDKKKLGPYKGRILNMIGNRVPKIKIASEIGVSRVTLDRYLKELEVMV
jgi:DNA invertase Pin-like site-specific DNA recombinase